MKRSRKSRSKSIAKPPGLCRSEGAEIPVLFLDLISRLCLIIEEGEFSRYLWGHIWNIWIAAFDLRLCVTSVAVNPCNLSFNANTFAAAFFFRWIFMALAIKKILLKKGINAAGKSGLAFTFDVRDKLYFRNQFRFQFLCEPLVDYVFLQLLGLVFCV